MNSLSFPDVNVWLALVLEHHVHHASAMEWWNAADATAIAWTRLTQLGVLRLLTTAAAMDGHPLSMAFAWQVYDRFFEDDRVVFHPEPVEFEMEFRRFTSLASVSPKLWADACLLAFASTCQGQVVTFDRALENRGVVCLLLR